MLRIVRNKSRPLLHMMRAWSVVAPHLVEVGYCSSPHVGSLNLNVSHTHTRTHRKLMVLET